MDPETSATLGEPDFPPKNGIIIKQGYMFVQETKKLLFMKWKVWRKRFITLRYFSKSASPVLEIDSRSGVAPLQVLLHLSGNSSAEMVDFSGPQDLACAKILQLIAKEESEPIIFKHASQDEMTDWVAAFKLTIALGETGSMADSDTDSSTWAGSLAPSSPITSDVPDILFAYGTADAPVFYTVRVLSCTLPSQHDVLIDRDYSLQISHHGVTLQEKSLQTTNIGCSRSWPMSSIKNISVENPNSSSSPEFVRIEIFRASTQEEGILLLRTSSAADLCQRVKILTANSANLKKSFTERLEHVASTRSSSGNRRPVSERSKKRPFIGAIGQQHNNLSFEQHSPVLVRTRRTSSRDSVKAMRNRRMGHFKLMDSRESTGSSNELNYSSESTPKKPPLLAQVSFGKVMPKTFQLLVSPHLSGGNTADHEGCGS